VFKGLRFGEGADFSGTPLHFYYNTRPYSPADSKLQGIICLDICMSFLRIHGKQIKVWFTSDRFQASAIM